MPELPLPPPPPPPSPQFGQLVPLSLDVKNDVLARITEPSNDDYDNGVSDNCDHNFGTFDDFGVKNDQKVSHNMILMSKYKGQHGGKTGSKNSGRGLPPPLFGQCPKENIFFFRRASLTLTSIYFIGKVVVQTQLTCSPLVTYSHVMKLQGI